MNNKLWLWMIVLLLSCSISWSQPKIKVINISDTTKVLIPINLLKNANVKLNERLHLLDIENTQNKIINDYKLYAIKQDSIIKDFQTKIIIENQWNLKLQNDIKKETNKYNTWKKIGIISSGLFISTFVLVIIK